MRSLMRNASTSPSPALLFRLDILKRELESIDNSIRKIDDIGNSIKNWAILAWTGSIAAILSKSELYGYLIFSALPPLVFLFVDAFWRRIQRRLTYRQEQIAKFLNGDGLDEAFKSGTLNFNLLDPIARRSSKNSDFIEFISVRKIITFPTISLIYAGLTAVSVLISLLVEIYPPKPPASVTPQKIGASVASAPTLQHSTSPMASSPGKASSP